MAVLHSHHIDLAQEPPVHIVRTFFADTKRKITSRSFVSATALTEIIVVASSLEFALTYQIVPIHG